MPPAEVSPMPEPLLPGEAVFDRVAALSRVNGDPKMLERFLRLFRERNTKVVSDISSTLAAQDMPTARRLAHTLNGGAGTVGLLELRSAAAKLRVCVPTSRWLTRHFLDTWTNSIGSSTVRMWPYSLSLR